MSNVRFREARQNHPRKMATGHYGVAGFAPQLVVSGVEGRIADERREFGDASAHLAQTGARRRDQGNAGPAANELRFDRERADGLSRSHQCARTDREEMEDEVKKFGELLCNTKLT